MMQIIDSKNYWKPLSQPLSAPIDRDAGSKIKFDRPLTSTNRIYTEKNFSEVNNSKRHSYRFDEYYQELLFSLRNNPQEHLLDPQYIP